MALKINNNKNIQNTAGTKIGATNESSNEKMNQNYQRFIKLFNTNLGIYPSACVFDFSKERMERAIMNMVRSVGIEEDNVYVICRYNRKFDEVLRNPSRIMKNNVVIEPFTFFLVLDESSEYVRGGNRYNDFDFPGLRGIEYGTLLSKQLLEKLSNLLDVNEHGHRQVTFEKVKFGGSKKILVKLSTNLCLRYILSIDPSEREMVIDILNVKHARNGRMFTVKISKSYVPLNNGNKRNKKNIDDAIDYALSKKGF